VIILQIFQPRIGKTKKRKRARKKGVRKERRARTKVKGIEKRRKGVRKDGKVKRNIPQQDRKAHAKM